MNNKHNITNYFFVTILFYLAIAKNLVLPTPGGIGLYLSPNIIGWVFISLMLSFGLWQISNTKKLIISHVHIKMVVGFLLLCIPAFYTHSNLYFAFPRILVLATGVAFLFALSQFRFSITQKHWLLFVLLSGIAIEAIVGLIQYYILLNFDIKIVGYTPVSNVPYGTSTQPNVMASFMATGIGLSLYLLKSSASKTINHSKLYYTFIWFCLLSTSLLLVLLQSKTGYLSFLITSLLFLPLLIKNKRHNKGIFISLLLGLCIGLFSLNSFENSEQKSNPAEDRHRSTMYHVGFDMISEKPLLGFGYGNFEKNYREAYIRSMDSGEITKPPQNILIHPHNEILLWVIEGGIVALLGIAFIVYSYICNIKLSFIREQLPVVALIIPISIHTQLEYPFYVSICSYIYFIIFFWLIIDSYPPKKELNIRNIFPVRVVSIIIPLTVIPFMLTTLHTSTLMEKYKQSDFSRAELINSIINKTSWNEYITITLHTESLKIGFKLKDINKLKNYVYWGREFVKQRPREALYQNMLIAIDTLERVNQPIDMIIKREVTTDAIRLYPENSNFLRKKESLQ